MRILILEDEVHLAEILKDWFEQKGFEIVLYYDGVSGFETASKDFFDVIISDVMLPKMDGFSFVKRIRDIKIQTPVIMLTARTALSDKLQGFEAGAEDYLTKPFDIEELDARVNVLLKKCSVKPAIKESNCLQCEDFKLEEDTHIIRNVKTDKNVKLSVKEYTLLKYFIENYNQVLTKEQITIRIWGFDTDVAYNNEEVYISFLRKKLKFIGTCVKIVTVRGIGYQLRGEV